MHFGRVALLGSSGLLGSQMESALTLQGANLVSFSRKNMRVVNFPGTLSEILENFDTIINCIGFTAVDRCETDSQEAFEINSNLPRLLAETAARTKARLIHFSTDYVFSGAAVEPYKVDAVPSPTSIYGESKALGEKFVIESAADFSIIRTAWLYGSGGRCFPKIMAQKLRESGRAVVVNDQHGQPTWTRDLAELTLKVLQLEKMPPIVHATASGSTSWAGFAKEIAISIGLNRESVQEISSAEYQTPAKRPSWSVLDNSSDVIPPIGDWLDRWREAAPEVLRGI